MWIDLTMTVTAEVTAIASSNENMVVFGHLGTHFDVMNLNFPLDFAKRSAIIFEMATMAAEGNDLVLAPELLEKITSGDFVVFHTGMIERVTYGTPEYFGNHPQLSDVLIDELIDRGVSMIGIDAAGIRQSWEHTAKDQYCADRGVFVVENLCNLSSVLNGSEFIRCDVYTFPIKFEGLSGLPCRVMAAI